MNYSLILEQKCNWLCCAQ